MRISTYAARTIRSAIIDARTKGWRKQPEMYVMRGRSGGAQLVDMFPLYGEAWRRTMKSRGLYPPPPPRSRPAAAQPPKEGH